MSRALTRPAEAQPKASVAAFAFWRALESTGLWLVLLTAILVAVRLGATPAQVALVLVAWLALRLPALVFGRQLNPIVSRGALGFGLAFVVVLNLLGLVEGLALVMLVAGLVGGLSALGAPHRAVVIQRTFPRSAHQAAARDGLVGWIGMAAGSTLASALDIVAVPGPTVLVGIAIVVTGLILTRAALFTVKPPVPTAAAPLGSQMPAAAGRSTGFEPLVRSGLVTHMVAAFASGAMLVALIGLLPYQGLDLAGQPGVGVLALAAVALGGLAARLGPLRLLLTRLHQRVPPVLLVGALAWAVGVLVVLVAWVGSLVLALPLLVGLGLVSAVLLGEHVMRARQLDEGRSARQPMLVAAAAGQLAGALGLALLGGEPAAIGGPLVALALAGMAAIVLALASDRGSLGALRYQVQQFSWNASPQPRAYEPPQTGTRAARLGSWISRQVELELVDVTLPVSGRRYAIARPSGDGRDHLFEIAKADPERQMPYWAKVWPSGVALADLVVERAAEVAGRNVLELGAGLGVTGCAVLEEDGRLITADYSLLPLALCRLNGLANAGRAPGSSCFNWRDEEQVREVLHRHAPIGLILAADVLYEYRDIQPLIDVVERLLAPDGSLWLAEPVRRTAQRYLDTVVALGWSTESRRIRAEWSDATDGWVNVHIIRREPEPSEAALGLGGWQL